MRERIVVCSNAFRGSVDQQSVASAICAGFGRDSSRYECVAVPISDGGDGTLSVCKSALGLNLSQVDVADAFGTPKAIPIGLSRDGTQAYIEAASVVGLGCARDLKPLQASTEGIGEAIVAALDLGARELFVALGGSATVDGGAGCLRALGARILAGPQITGADPISLGSADSLDCSDLDARLRKTKIFLLCDTDISLASSLAFFGEQKGLVTVESREIARRSLDNWSILVKRATGRDLSCNMFTGCNGGVAFALMCALNVEALYGADVIFDMLKLRSVISSAAAIVTSEGRYDVGSSRGKASYRVGHLARELGIPAYLLTAVPNADADAVTDDLFVDHYTLFQGGEVRSRIETLGALQKYGKFLRSICDNL